MYTLSRIEQIQKDEEMLRDYSIDVACKVSKLRNVNIPSKTSSSDIDTETKTVTISWKTPCGRGCCSDSYYLEYPIDYLNNENYLEIEEAIIHKQLEMARLKKITDEEIKDKVEKERRRSIFNSLKEEFGEQ